MNKMKLKFEEIKAKIFNLFKKTNKETEVIKKKDDNFFKDFFEAFLIFIFVSTFFYQGFLIPSGSMKPQLIEGDCILVSKFEYGYTRFSFPFSIPFFKERIFDWKKPKRGDVVVFRLPIDTRINYIKRLIGLPGDKIQVKNRILYINGEEIKKEYIEEYLESDIKEVSMFKETFENNKEIKILQNMKEYIKVANDTIEYVIPEGFYFFMGDNRDNSLDSRFSETGFVPYENIIGKAKIIFFSRGDSLLKFWKWHKTIKFRRILNLIK